jgi:hypothetical protein
MKRLDGCSWVFGWPLSLFLYRSSTRPFFSTFVTGIGNRRVRRNSLTAQRQNQRTNEVAIQAFLYVAAFCGTIIWMLILIILESISFNASHEGTLFPILVLNGLLVPSTGFFNLCILRPRYLKTRTTFPRETRLWATDESALWPQTRNDGVSDDGGSSSHALGVFRLGSLRKFYMDSAAVPSSSLANSPPSDPSTMMDQSSMTVCVGKENLQGTKIGHVDTDAKAQLEVP